MLVVDASCVYEVVTDGHGAPAARRALLADQAHAAPHVVDVETFGVIRRAHQRGELDRTAAALAVRALGRWPVERFDHRPLLARAWELRASVRGWDAMYVALAEVLGAVLLTFDRRLAKAHGPGCEIVALDHAEP